MNVTELYAGTPAENHSDILISGDRLFHDGEEYLIEDEGELKLVHSHKVLEQRLTEIKTHLGA